MQITIRSSYLSSYNDCPRRSIARIAPELVKKLGIDLRRTPNGIGSIIGTASHAAAAYRLEKRMITGQQDPGEAKLSDCTDLAIANMRDGLRDGVEMDQTTPSITDGEKQIQQLVRSWIYQVDPVVTPERVEIRAFAKISDEVMLSGQPDCEGGPTVDDWKFGGVSRSMHGQFGGYTLLRMSAGEKTDLLRMWHIPRTPVKKAFPGASLHEYDPAVCSKVAYATIGRITRDVSLLENTGNPVYMAANPMSMLCSAKYCPVWGTDFCELTKGRTR